MKFILGMKETKGRHFEISVKFAVAKETEKFAKAKRMFNDNLEA